jgi:hypothetical protein
MLKHHERISYISEKKTPQKLPNETNDASSSFKVDESIKNRKNSAISAIPSTSLTSASNQKTAKKFTLDLQNLNNRAPTQQRDQSRVSPILSERRREKPLIAFGSKVEKSATRKSVVSGISQTIEPLPNRLIGHGNNLDLDTTQEAGGSGHQDLQVQKQPTVSIRTQSGLTFENDSFLNTDREKGSSRQSRQQKYSQKRKTAVAESTRSQNRLQGNSKSFQGMSELDLNS